MNHLRHVSSAHFTRRTWLGQAFALATGATLPFGAARAQPAYPTRPVTLIVPYPPGGSNDNVARPLARELSKVWGQPVVVDNRPGAGGVIGAAALARSAPDGYTLGLVSSSFTTSAVVQKNLPFDPVKDFAPVARANVNSFVLLVSPALKANNLAELVALMKKSPGKFSYGTSGVGSINQFGTELFANLTGTKLIHVPYKGMAPALTDLAGGHVDIVLASVPSAHGLLVNKTARALAVTSAARLADFPEIPTAVEAGVPGYEFEAWSGFLAPARTPEPIIQFINKAINAAAVSPDVAKSMALEGANNFQASTPEGFRAMVNADLQRWKKIAVAQNIQAE